MSPIKDITVQRLQKRTLEDFAHIHCSGAEPMRPVWCDGLVLALYRFNGESDLVIQKDIEGHVMYEEISYAECPKYTPRLRDKDKKELETPVMNYDGDDLIRALVTWIKSQ